MKKLVIIKDNKAITTSLKVAEIFNKDHKHVLDKIDKLVDNLHEPKNGLMHESEQISQYFTITTQNLKIGNGAIRQNRMYTMTRDGFVLLAMGFTGKKALQFKLAYIEAFNKMESTLTGSYSGQLGFPDQFSPAVMKALGGIVKRCASAAIREEVRNEIESIFNPDVLKNENVFKFFEMMKNALNNSVDDILCSADKKDLENRRLKKELKKANNKIAYICRTINNIEVN